jgi:hypothetical protein
VNPLQIQAQIQRIVSQANQLQRKLIARYAAEKEQAVIAQELCKEMGVEHYFMTGTKQCQPLDDLIAQMGHGFHGWLLANKADAKTAMSGATPACDTCPNQLACLEGHKTVVFANGVMLK